MCIFINYFAQTSANQSQDIIDAKLDKRRKGVYGPPMGKRAVIFVDDLNMPQLEAWRAAADRAAAPVDGSLWLVRPQREHVPPPVDLSFVWRWLAGRRSQPDPPRYMRHFNIVAFTPFDEPSMQLIFKTILDWFLVKEGFESEYQRLSAPIIGATMGAYQRSLANLLPTPSKSHYTFNLRDFARVVQGMCLCSKDDFEQPKELMLLWTHEVLRVFYDG